MHGGNICCSPKYDANTLSTILTGHRIYLIKRNIIADVQQASSNLNSNLDKLNSTLTQVNFAQQTVKRAESRYNSGVGTNLDLLDAETSLAGARLFYLQDLYKSILSSYQLRRAVGDVIY